MSRTIDLPVGQWPQNRFRLTPPGESTDAALTEPMLAWLRRAAAVGGVAASKIPGAIRRGLERRGMLEYGHSGAAYASDAGRAAVRQEG